MRRLKIYKTGAMKIYYWQLINLTITLNKNGFKQKIFYLQFLIVEKSFSLDATCHRHFMLN